MKELRLQLQQDQHGWMGLQRWEVVEKVPQLHVGDYQDFFSRVQAKQLISLQGAGNQVLLVLREDYLHLVQNEAGVVAVKEKPGCSLY